MSDANRENLSAFIDGELQHEQIRFLLRNLDHDVELRALWARYHVIRDGVRRQVPVLAGDGLVGRVMDAITGEVPATTHGRRRWLQWSAGGAIAAGVAAVALMVVQPPPTATTASASAPVSVELATTANAQPASTLPASAPTVPRWLSATPSAAQLAQPAAATFYPVGPGATAPAGYTRGLAPYMTIPSYRASQMREARNDSHPPLWLQAPPPHAAQQPQHSARQQHARPALHLQ